MRFTPVTVFSYIATGVIFVYNSLMILLCVMFKTGIFAFNPPLYVEEIEEDESVFSDVYSGEADIDSFTENTEEELPSIQSTENEE